MSGRRDAKRSKARAGVSTYGAHPELLPLKAAEKGVTKVHKDLLGLGISMGKKDMITVMFEMVLEKVVNVKLKDGTAVEIEWKRENKKKKDSSGSVFVENKEVLLNHHIKIPTTMWKSHATGRLVKKNVTFYLKRNKVSESGHMEHITVGKVTMDLANFGRKDGQVEKVVLYFLKKLNSSPALHLRIKATWLELNKQLLTPVEGTPAKGVKVVDIEGVQYYLTDRGDESDDAKRVSGSSETDSLGSGVDSVGASLTPAPEGASSLVLSSMYDELRQRFEMLEQTNYKQVKIIQEHKQTVSKLNKELDKSKENFRESKRQFKKEQTVLFTKNAERDAVIQNLRQELEGKDTVIRGLHSEVEELRRITKVSKDDKEDQDEHLSSVEAKYRALLEEQAETTRTLAQAAEIFAMQDGRAHTGPNAFDSLLPSSTPFRMALLFALLVVLIVLW